MEEVEGDTNETINHSENISNVLNENEIQSKKQKSECSICKKTFTSESSVRKHKKFVHDKITTGKFHSCDKCEKKYSRKSELTKHNKVIHETNNIFKCQLCSKTLKRKKTLFSCI